ncbi:MAG: class I SAM-dependent methyltransferase [Planctomycetia bacterium]|nr:class I SAM-dependent methyltransferase [Candidatus Brocadia sp.]QOJ06228.1 MAG: class I SAM-dependent methyltransferase [Planctomycetia bacterium]TVL94818.1 MAG: hypothetical protein CV082_13400 [Candidatus Brocadia sp. BL1]HQU32325.1 methyltransferase domain-containing protein [Candidatus Brocadia sapporoensis]
MELLINSDFWTDSWKSHLENYLSAPPRAGIFINTFLGTHFNSVLEIAAGSSRDSRYLSRCGFDATASDFCENTIGYLKNVRFPNDILKYSVEDARRLSFADNSFDLTFHNGFLICFKENETIFETLKEQERISKKYILFFVHNSSNKKLTKKFLTLSKKDKLYDVRFFSIDEVRTIVIDSGINIRSLTIKKFGGICDILYADKIKIFNNPFRRLSPRFVPHLYQFQKWNNTERIACIIELNK